MWTPKTDARDPRDVIANAVAENHERGIRPTTEAVVAALRDAGFRIVPDTGWEWGVRGPARVSLVSEEAARQVVADPELNDEGNLVVARLWPDDASLDAAHEAAEAKIGGLFKGDLGVQVAHEIAHAVLEALTAHAVPRAAVLALADAHTHEAAFDCTERCEGRQEVAAELRALAGGDQ